MKCLFYFFLIFLPQLFFAQEIKSEFKDIKSNTVYNFILKKPFDTSQTRPLILFLHGSGERGDDISKVKTHGPLKYLKDHKLDCYVLAPQCPVDKYWETEILFRMIKEIVSKYNIDNKRIHLTGLSMGAWGAWNLAIDHPELFASLVLFAGFVDRIPMIEACKLKEIPIRIFHGQLDDVVDVFYSKEIYKRLKKCSQNIEITIFDDANHDSWTRVYENDEIYKWILMHSKN